MLTLALAAVVAAGCGDDDESTTSTSTVTSGGSEKIVALEASLLENISDVRDEEPALETVECPDDADLEAKPAQLTCELSGGDQTGSVEVTVRGNEYEYTGSFATSSFGGSGNEIVPD